MAVAMYPIGSNTKLFTAVAAWQLHRAGKLSVYEPAAKYMAASELGLDSPWDSSTSPTSFNFTAYQAMQLGAASIAEYLQLIGVLRMPLEFRPGSSYHYSNPGYSIVGYIVEKVSGLPLADYFRIHIFDKCGLSSTLYDPTNGAVGIHKQQLPYPAYITYLQPGQDAALADTSGASIQQLAASAGSPRYWAGDVPSNTSAAAAAATVAGKQAAANSSADGSIRVGMTAKFPGPSGFDWSLANAAGAIVSTPQDMAKWLRALLVGPDHLGLGKELLKEFLGLSTDVAGMPRLTVRSNGSFVNATLEFAQGLVVLKDAAHARGLGVSSVYYLGSLGGFQAAVYMWLDPRDPAKDVFINAVAATVLPERSGWPAAAQNLTRSQASSPSLQSVLCDLSNMVPGAMKTLPDMLARNAFRGLNGFDWFNLQ
ncbi:beta-lactamase/transpeptidase-like protein [Scenedesmus sp. NREL 46B-D3]|nr:beta-lactamase/transpeptidase-like protein [Scenedesmus sp. NREL 46B-D3]